MKKSKEQGQTPKYTDPPIFVDPEPLGMKKKLSLL